MNMNPLNVIKNSILKFRPTTTSYVLMQARNKCQAGRYRITLKRNRPLTYEQANKPSLIGVRKGWNSWNTSSLLGTPLSSEIAIEDEFIRKFLAGTWHRLFLSEIIIKRHSNTIRIGGIVNQTILPQKYYFLLGYTEELLSNLLKSPVKIDICTTEDKNALIYKYI
ncbi:phosphomannomutase [Sarcoptes scabiei]|nr:phosphomannomutase [Sarcoptes scabiei]